MCASGAGARQSAKVRGHGAIEKSRSLVFEKMPRFITGDELGNLKAYVSSTEKDGTKVRCSELLVETDKRKSVQMLAIAKSTVGNIQGTYVEMY